MTSARGIPGRPMDVHVEKLSPVLIEFQIEVPADQVTTEVNKQYSQLKRTAKVRGFRKGKAPRHVLAHLYGRAIHADVAQRLMDTSLQQALNDKSIQPLTKPSVEPAELKLKEAFSFKARFEVRPEIEKVTWEGLEATRKSAEVTDEQLEEEIERLRVEHATMEPVEKRGAEKGDIATLALSFEVDGEEKTEELDNEIGSGQILKAIDEGLMGMKAGEQKTVTESFPENHPMADLRGKETNFKLDLKELKQKVLPKVDDEFAKDCEHDDLKAMRAALTEKLGAKLKQDTEEDVARQLVAQLCEKNVVPVPPSLVEQQAKMSEQELRFMAQMSGQQVDESTFGERLRADAEMKVRAGLLMAEIAKEKKVQVTQEDIDSGYEELATQTGKNVAKIKAEYREKNKRDMLIGMILEDKVLDLMEKSAKISDE
jgi:trigger factor